MKKILLVATITAMIWSCNNKKDKSEDKKEARTETSRLDSLLITDTSWGLITANSDIDYLKKTFGEANVKDDRICGPECVDTLDVTIIHENTSRALTIYWQDQAYHKKVERVESEIIGSPYHTASGLRVGSTLREVQKAYPGTIKFSGFGWDYGGYVGFLGDSLKNYTQISIRLDLSEHTGEQGLYGDTELSTDMPIVQKNLDKIIISALSLVFMHR